MVHPPRILGVVVATAVLAVANAAQSSIQLLTEGGTVIGAGAAESFEDMAALDTGPSGLWWLKVDTSAAANVDLKLVLNGFVTLSEGALTSMPGVTVSDFIGFYPDTLCTQLSGILALQGAPITAANDRGLFWGLNLLRQEGDASAAPEVSPGTTYTMFHRSRFNSAQDGLLLARMDDPAIPGIESAVVLFDLEEHCNQPQLLSEHVLVRTGDKIPAGSNNDLNDFASTEKGSFDLNARGEYMFVGTFNSSSLDRRVVLNDKLVLSETQPTPGGAGSLVGLHLASLDINDLGDYVVQANTSVGPAIIRGSSATPAVKTKVIQVSDPVPDPSMGAFVMTKVGYVANPVVARHWAPVIITNSGDVIWYGEWNDPDQSQNGGIFVNDRVVVRKGSQHAGKTVFAIGSQNLDAFGNVTRQLRYEVDASPNGRFLLFEATTGTAGPDETVFIMDLGESVPYGTVAQGCTYPYPDPNLDHVSGRVTTGLPGQTIGGLPLVGHTFHASIDSAPAGTTSITLAFTNNAHANFPCGMVLPGLEYLLGSGSQGQLTHVGTAPTSFAVGPVPPSMFNVVSHAQAFFTGASGTLGATNGIRFVFGAQ